MTLSHALNDGRRCTLFDAYFSDDRKVDNPKFTPKMEKKLRREQRKLSRRALIEKKERY
ncbi:hypothetical protein [Gracilibacillus boraciitolerans]|uniref:hypothetical protein n=1 Tax=Gracilibacillus boraciitolerans TaxID=307521 RepID=UPI001F32A1FB|nr:hypothetical protein [Gracilibacillus boraciitolerans]